MSHPTSENISSTYTSNHWLINQLIDGLTHEDSLIQPPFPANCLNWILGHIIRGRNTALILLDVEPIFTEELVNRFKTGSPPVTGPDDAVPFDKLVNNLNISQERLTAAL
ncbi:MAG: hypothetical protein GWN61_15570, partial [candidate division Zixibacteria bacterium]|nr:hypothetical protein [Gammaproteobacteria bacterium]NIR65656.1 hypothetical protein [candidate division Zixibacteria bacterium]NIV07551.1 hypothetical protein [candidate division Zixibacteria bacterium]NIW46747.1 hypothetical protein [Gammaproteobacteria bacterium]